MVDNNTASGQETTLHEKLFEIQQELKSPKSLKNDFAGFNYRSAEGILSQLKPLLAKHKLVIALSDEVVNIGESNYVQATATLSDGKNTTKTIAYAREEVTKKGMDSAQITGSTSSYARKYALSGLFGIDDNKDPDSQDNSDHQAKSTPKASANKPASPGQKKFIKDLLEQRGVSLEEMAQHLEDEYGIIPGTEMTSADASSIIEDLR